MVAAITTLISYTVAFMYVLPKVNRQWVIKFDMKTIIKSIIASFFMGVIMNWYVLFFNKSINSTGIIVIGMILSLIIYCIMIFMFKVFSKPELRLLKSIFY
jgi:hypothetical protein